MQILHDFIRNFIRDKYHVKLFYTIFVSKIIFINSSCDYRMVLAYILYDINCPQGTGQLLSI